MKNFEINYYHANFNEIDFNDLKDILNYKDCDVIDIFDILIKCNVHSIKFNDETFYVYDLQLIYSDNDKNFIYMYKRYKEFNFNGYCDEKLYSLHFELKHNFKLINTLSLNDFKI